MIFLPGTDKQIKFFFKNSIPAGKNILIAGSGSDRIALRFVNAEAADIQIISNDSSDVMDLRLRTRAKNVSVKMMDFTNTDYPENTFDYIYSQASFSTADRKKIYKEVLRILKPSGNICSGEIIKIPGEIPRFLQDVWKSSGILPLTLNEQLSFYKESGFEVTAYEDLSFTLTEFYKSGKDLLKRFKQESTPGEQKNYKKLLNKISHESNAYLNLGGRKYMEFHAFILKRVD